MHSKQQNLHGVNVQFHLHAAIFTIVSILLGRDNCQQANPGGKTAKGKILTTFRLQRIDN